MANRTYNPENYEPETRAAIEQLLDSHLNFLTWLADDTTEAADIIEKAVLKAKQVTEEKIRAACAAVAEAYLTNPKREDQ